MQAPSRARELAVVAALTGIVTVKVAVAARFGSGTLAATVAAVGAAVVAAWFLMANRMIRDARERG